MCQGEPHLDVNPRLAALLRKAGQFYGFAAVEAVQPDSDGSSVFVADEAPGIVKDVADAIFVRSEESSCRRN